MVIKKQTLCKSKFAQDLALRKHWAATNIKEQGGDQFLS